jgi:Bacterial Ig-like domain (group 1)
LPTLPIARFVSPARTLFLASAFAVVAACGGGGAKAPDGGGSPTGPGTPTAPTATLAISLVDPATGITKNAISSGSPGLVKALVKDASGNVVSGAVVTFTTDAALATFSPSSGTALTDSNGQASVTIVVTDVNAAGAANITAKTDVGTESPEGTTAFAIGATSVTLSNVVIGQTPLSAFGTTSVVVTVLSNGVPVTTPLTVNFTSGCVASGKADLTPSVRTGGDGKATASYHDKGCGTVDTISVNLSGIASTATASIDVRPPNTGSIQFKSAIPTQITLKGTGGAGLQETAEVRFKVLDEGGFPVGGKTVTFALSTGVGGVSLTSTSAVSDATTGEVSTNVVSGSISTPVRVLATTTNSAQAILATQSDQLTITTGVPTQTAFSLAVSTLNIEGWDFDGENTTLTARLADHFGNPPPAGTVVNFVTEGAKIGASCTTSAAIATTEAGVCSSLFTSQNLRPTNGRVSILGYAVGEEGFTDLNGDGFVDSRAELVDSNGDETVGFGEAFVNYNENYTDDLNPSIRSAIRNTTGPVEPFIDFNASGTFSDALAAETGLYKGILCKSFCDPSKTLNIRQNAVVVLSGSDPYISGQIAGLPIPGIINVTAGAVTVAFRISDLHGNALPAGTIITFTGTNTDVPFQGGSFPVGNTAACMSDSDKYVTPVTGGVIAPGLCPLSARNLDPFSYSATFKAPDTPKGSQGFVKLTVTTPNGTTLSVSFETLVL